jgi:hypothetical protein
MASSARDSLAFRRVFFHGNLDIPVLAADRLYQVIYVSLNIKVELHVPILVPGFPAVNRHVIDGPEDLG